MATGKGLHRPFLVELTKALIYKEHSQMSRRAVSLLSGGLDSTTLLYQLKFEGFEPTALIVDYGQRHAIEMTKAQVICAVANIPFKQLNLSAAFGPLFAGAQSSQVGAKVDVPHGHYAAENMKTTIVPNRNMMLLAMAGALAETIGAEVVAYAAHAGDHTIYPDCRPEFYESCAQTLFKATDGRVTLYAPFGTITKGDIAKRAKGLRVPVELTWSCYDPQFETGMFIHCGKCGTCVERKEAMAEAFDVDPTKYAA